ncbi:TonB-dependent siderophore receptor [Burkholderia multivorans]|uniref:TonB-dependent siderophore receptor n=1 Tax=Burkholderia multivorans TaxID=87883 RepID=UPI00158E71D7|nr:TonB-dependent siderophore receptor [Burkholderia multivorans]MBR8044590.1 TonB-dependent siderophore receptor [Burkholderia multivorans]MBU9487870.1 TonB-dependent siderophore receptor [Burkholderia multivorans]MDR8874403.1 Ferrichrome outer membrane transporter/phage receptor [Burkholderia multivorans]MDR8880924.1 Ferrichrome outer membrane transporter/phage receptor [Burkholderia multivorans]MDR8886311.1 Ferrichrome outer membrane transporter/phage receptor [Burkholderia multivorans]
MDWATGTRLRAIAAAASVAFGAAAAGQAFAQTAPAANAQAAAPNAASAGTLPAITVNAASEGDGTVGLVAKRSRTGTKTDTPIEEIPQTINVVTAQQIEMTGATDVNTALRYVPGFSSYGSDNRSDWYAALRGFTPTAYVNGLQVPNTLNLASWRVDPYMIDSITVLRGPTSVLYGAGDPGAIVDVKTKLADGERVREAGVEIGNYARKQFMIDVGDKLDPDGKYAYRFVGVARDGNAVTGPNNDQRVALAPSFRWRPNADTSLTLSATYLQDWGDISSNFLPAAGTVLPNPNGQITKDIYEGDGNFNYYRKKQWSLGYQFEHNLNSMWTFRQNTRWMHLSLDNGSVWGAGFADETLTEINRWAGVFQMNYSRFDIDNNLEGRFATGPLQHTLLLGFQYNRQTATDSEWLAAAPTLNLYNPVYTPVTTAVFSDPDTTYRTNTYTTMNTFGLYAQDQIKWNRWTLTLGGREDWVNMRMDDRAAGTQSKADVSAFTGRVGLTYQAGYGLSPYISYSTSFNPIIGVSLLDGGVPKPTRGRQIEAGLRWQPPGKNLMLNAAIYQINQTNGVTPALLTQDPSGTKSVQTGEVRARGIELSATGKVTPNLSLIASYAYQDVKVVQANDATLNNWPVDIPRPRQMASLWADWTWHTGLLAGFGLGGGVRYQSASAGAADNSLTVSSYTLIDAAVHYDVRNWRFAVNATNLFNRHYISGCQSTSVCMFGNDRTVIATAKYNW